MATWCYRISVFLLLAGIGLAVVSGWQWRQQTTEAGRIRQLAEGQGHAPDADASPLLRLAWANHLVQRGRYEEALTIYSDLLESASAGLMPWIHYNLGNLYLRRAREQVEKTAFDEAIPLVALARGAYRRALRRKPDLWAARYNLEAAIRLLPEIERIEAKTKEGKEPAEEALWTRVPGFPRGLP
ncbi:mxaK protein [Methylomarinovum caldicuralii]|uniref:MxaK protein n=1 Tax=Methylomarinovum caldicuralii TaxID=438856 RepID=A0AAU9BU67_9GAMM|nr:MxaK protein [Methylomarinovum caldicuralii]BCX82488.1 mxaK protein [Methylomarinovum caldicuralii]